MKQGMQKVFAAMDGAKEVKEIWAMEIEIYNTETRLANLKDGIKNRVHILTEWIKTAGGTVGELVLDHIIAKYEVIDRDFLKILRDFEQEIFYNQGQIILVVSAFEPIVGKNPKDIRYHYLLTVLKEGGFAHNDDPTILEFSTSYVVNWWEGQPLVISQCKLGPSIKDFDWDLRYHDAVLNADENVLKNQFFIGDGEVWKFFKAANNKTKDEIRKAFKNLKIEKTYTW